MFNDFVTRKQRLTRKDHKADFRLADSDDFFGFDGNAYAKQVKWVGYVVIAVAVLAMLLIIRAVQADCIASNGISLCD